MKEKTKIKIVNAITGTRLIGTLLLPLIATIFGPLGTAIYIGTIWATDLVDGKLARHWDVSTIFGANFDAFCDKFFGIATLIYLISFYPILLLPIGLETSIVIENWISGKKGADVKSSMWGKVKTVVLGITTGLGVLSTISLTSSLAYLIPSLIAITSGLQTITLTNYVKKNHKYLKEHELKSDKSDLGFMDTISEIAQLLKNEKIYSPAFFKEHKNKPLLEQLCMADEIKKNHSFDKNDNLDDEKHIFDQKDLKELKITYNFDDKEINQIEEYVKNNNLDSSTMMNYLELYVKYKDSMNSPTIKTLTSFIEDETAITFTDNNRETMEILYNLTNEEINKLEKFANIHKIDEEKIIDYLTTFFYGQNKLQPQTADELENFLNEQIKVKKHS